MLVTHAESEQTTVNYIINVAGRTDAPLLKQYHAAALTSYSGYSGVDSCKIQTLLVAWECNTQNTDGGS